MKAEREREKAINYMLNAKDTIVILIVGIILKQNQNILKKE